MKKEQEEEMKEKKICLFDKTVSRRLLDFEDRMNNIILDRRSENLTKFFNMISVVFGPVTLIVTSFSLFAFYYKMGFTIEENLGSSMVFSVFFTSPFNVLIKILFGRERPPKERNICKKKNIDKYAFPSGDTMCCTVFFSFIAYIVIDTYYRKIHESMISIIPIIIIIVSCALCILLVAISRVYLGVHNFLDVVFGFLVGIIEMSLFCMIKDFNNDLWWLVLKIGFSIVSFITIYFYYKKDRKMFLLAIFFFFVFSIAVHCSCTTFDNKTIPALTYPNETLLKEFQEDHEMKNGECMMNESYEVPSLNSVIRNESEEKKYLPPGLTIRKQEEMCLEQQRERLNECKK